MGKMITGSICLTDLSNKYKEGHSAFTTGKNGKIYMSILVWENDEPDQYNNNFSVQLNPVKDAPDNERKQYIGNLKYVATNVQPAANSAMQQSTPVNDDLPF